MVVALSQPAAPAVKSKRQNGVKVYPRKATGGIVMSAPKIATLLGIAGMFGVVIAVMLGTLPGADYLLDTAFVCLVLAGVIMILHVLIGLWTDFTRSA
jgi:proteasome assembly chaperone (PAC2) family protein